jgi:hypothetical protein
MPRSSAILRLEDRIHRLRPILAAFKETHDTRHLLYNLELKGQYCATCSPTNSPGACGRTCSLLCPTPNAPRGANECWHSDVVIDYGLYCQIMHDMDRHELDATEDRVLRWEHATDDLRRGAMNCTEQFAEGKWRHLRPSRRTPGLDLNWSFESAWGAKARAEEPVPLRRRGSRSDRKSLKRPSSDTGGRESKRGKW